MACRRILVSEVVPNTRNVSMQTGEVIRFYTDFFFSLLLLLLKIHLHSALSLQLKGFYKIYGTVFLDNFEINCL